MAENKDMRHDEKLDFKDVVSLKDAQVVRFEMDICTENVCYRIKASDGKLIVEPAEPKTAEADIEAEKDREAGQEE